MTEPTVSIPVIRNRVQSIDILRGIVMVIMALDHVRDFIYRPAVQTGGASAVAMDPTKLATTTPILFFTRWITHFCAPIFVFLAGTSIFLMGQKKTKQELSFFLLKRGLFLALVEIIIITFGWRFDPLYHIIILQVIWAIGISMIILGLLIFLPYEVLFVLGVILVFGHNVLDYPRVNSGLKGGDLANLVYFSNFSPIVLDKTHVVIVVYAFLPWVGVMLLGYCFGKLYAKGVNPAWRKKNLVLIGCSLIALFLVLRFINKYGDPAPWSEQQRGPVYTFLSFLNLTKYPPSLLFLCMTLGPGILLLAFIENVQNRFSRIMNVYGRVPMFYYILHFFIIHIIVVILFYAQGRPSSEIDGPDSLFFFKPPAVGLPLAGVYAVWLFVVIVLYPLCKKYDRYKSTHQQWWLKYI
ncbi:MAG TPA: heparan-alpha-glucosaminide N-acetyltransferase domain-containing protein [Chitinophagaceae bacterium]|nr:heparan-alpha-glucosaminide N-acetyltransferase domain-containing protein [Chitinophagaceae bacterium]